MSSLLSIKLSRFLITWAAQCLEFVDHIQRRQSHELLSTPTVPADPKAFPNISAWPEVEAKACQAIFASSAAFTSGKEETNMSVLNTLAEILDYSRQPRCQQLPCMRRARQPMLWNFFCPTGYLGHVVRNILHFVRKDKKVSLASSYFLRSTLVMR